MSVPRVILKAKRAQPFFARHPWVFAGAVGSITGSPADGDEVELCSSVGNFIARGLFNRRSKIHVRLYSWVPERPLDASFFRERLLSAISLRDRLGLRGPDRGSRLVFSEGDFLSGLTIDEYSGFLSVQLTTLSLAMRKEMLADLLTEIVQPRGIYIRTERGLGKLEGMELQDGLLRGEQPPPDLEIVENGLRIQVNLPEGQKTGYYLDQRDNRLTAARYAKGRAILDAFSYTGGFGLHAAAAGAASVECVDVSASALATAQFNAQRNDLKQMTFVRADVFKHLDDVVRAGRKYDMVLLDPPKFARSRSSIPEAMKGYRRLQTLAVRLLNPDGMLVTSCCSGLITADMLTELLSQIAAEEKRDIQLLGRGSQAPDHPIAATCMESSYLKCFFTRVL